MENAVSPEHLKWFEDRGINHETVINGGIYSGRHVTSGEGRYEVVPDANGRIIVYPYLRHGLAVNHKYRAPGKRFYQQLGGTKVFWNAEILDDPSLHDGTHSLVIVEGENDALSVMEAGYPFVVSVPDGAPPPRKSGQIDEEINPEHDDKYAFIFNDWDVLKKIKCFVIAVDNDEPGKRLAEELVRRLGRIRCQFVEFPEGCKDFNEVLQKQGNEYVIGMIDAAKPYPVSGLHTLRTLPKEPDLVPLSTGWKRVDAMMMPFFPAFMVVTGKAGSGKSSWVNQMVAQMAFIHGIRVGIASFEMRINPFVTKTLASVHYHMKVPGNAEEWIDDSFVFIAPEPSKEEDQFDVEWLIEKAEAAVIRYGIRILVIDPWNEIEHAVGRRESLTDYTGRAIRALKRFGREFECLVVVVAHPTKSAADKDPEDISLYDISDSAHFANKADFGVVVARSNLGPTSNIMVKKVRYQPETGKPGADNLTYFPDKKRFSEDD